MTNPELDTSAQLFELDKKKTVAKEFCYKFLKYLQNQLYKGERKKITVLSLQLFEKNFQGTLSEDERKLYSLDAVHTELLLQQLNLGPIKNRNGHEQIFQLAVQLVEEQLRRTSTSAR